MNAQKNYLPKTVGIIYSYVRPEYFPTKEQYLTEKDAFRDAKILAKYLEKLNIRPILYPATPTLSQRLRKDKPDMILNLIGSIKGLEYLSASIPGILELHEIPYTGSDMLGMSLDYNKFLVKKLLEQNGVPVPRYQLFNTASDLIDPTLRFPLISKLNEIHGGVEIDAKAIAENERQLRDRLKFLIKTYQQPVLVEEFIVGREIECFLFEGKNKKVYLSEIVFTKVDGKYKYTLFNQQWQDHHEKIIQYKKYDDPLLKEYVKKAFDIMRMSDYGKFDVRLDNSGRYFFIDSNVNPYFGPKEIETPMAFTLDLYGVPFLDILKRILLNTMREAEGKGRIPITTNGES